MSQVKLVLTVAHYLSVVGQKTQQRLAAGNTNKDGIYYPRLSGGQTWKQTDDG